MRFINNPITAFIVLASFSLLAWYAYPTPASYSVSVFSVLDKQSNLKQQQKTALMDIWHISEREINQPIAIFGKE